MIYSLKNAIVIGGGVAGLLAAHILANHCDKVTLIERDIYPEEPVFRAGVPQGRQVHTMLLRGQHELERLFPGIGERLVAQGAIRRTYGYDTLSSYGGVRCIRVGPLLPGWNCSRLLLEWQLRQELRAHSQIHLLEGHEVVNLLFGQGKRVCGVQFRERTSLPTREKDIRTLSGDLIIDAGGMSSAFPMWLKEQGYEVPYETMIDASVGYATRFYAKPAHMQIDWKGMTVQGEHQRGGLLMEIEHEQWMLVLTGVGEDHPSTKENEFLTFAQSLPEQTLYKMAKDATPLSSIYGYRRTENRRRHVEQQRHFPENLLVMGDAACCFNPIYGQGMTVSVLEAIALDRCLSQGRKRLAPRFHRHVARIVAGPWRIAAATDARNSSKNRRPSFSVWYMERLTLLLPSNERALLTFYKVLHMLLSPAALLSPMLLWKVLTYKPVSPPQKGQESR